MLVLSSLSLDNFNLSGNRIPYNAEYVYLLYTSPLIETLSTVIGNVFYFRLWRGSVTENRSLIVMSKPRFFWDRTPSILVFVPKKNELSFLFDCFSAILLSNQFVFLRSANL